ncbi:MAG: DUF3443 domain-containing protein [Vicinamibacterales bacterium]
MIRPLLMGSLVIAMMTPRCGDSSTAPDSSTPPLNFQSIVVNAGPANNYFNGAFTSVTICVPGQSACQTIDGILVDTGSTGLRVLASSLTLPLPQQTDTSRAPVAECFSFLDGYTWGAVKSADIKMGSEQASGVPIQVIGASGLPAIPPSCSSSGTSENTLPTLGANGVLGVGLFRQDCGSGCADPGSSNPGLYYACPSSGCQAIAQSLARQIQNPVSLFSTDNNGVAIQLPSVAQGGALTATGMIIFGIGTQSDNTLGTAKVLTVDGNGNLSTSYGSQTYGGSYIDSGSNGIFFLDTNTTGLPLCTGGTDFYCPARLQPQSATIRGTNGTTSAVAFNVGNADALNARFTAFSEIAGPNPGGFAWGLSFFFGRTVYTAIEGQSTPGGVGPYFAF